MNEPEWIQPNVAIAINHELINMFGGLNSGIRDENLFLSALERPKNKWQYDNPKPSLFQLSAAYCYAITRDHPFIDGNKRTAYQVAYTFLGLNNFEHDTDDVDVVKIILLASEGSLSETKLSEWFEKFARKL